MSDYSVLSWDSGVCTLRYVLLVLAKFADSLTKWTEIFTDKIPTAIDEPHYYRMRILRALAPVICQLNYMEFDPIMGECITHIKPAHFRRKEIRKKDLASRFAQPKDANIFDQTSCLDVTPPVFTSKVAV